MNEMMEYKITDKFWGRYRELVRKEMIPFQWSVLNDAIDVKIEKERDDNFIPNEKSHAIENFKIAAKRTEGEHYGWVFQDSDVYKWLEAVAYSLADKPDANLKSLADSVVDLIGEAQEEDGYLDTYFTIKEPDRKFKRLSDSHELYCAGHFIEAAVAYNEASGNEKVLAIATKLADCICNNFGPEEGKIHGYDGHEEIELALMKLFHVTGEKKYMNMAEYFLSERGKDPDFFRKQNRANEENYIIKGLDAFPDTYFQNHLPVTEQTTAEGHAVRLVYMCTALADLAATSGNEKFIKACKTIWRNIVDKRMYITGGIGSTVIGESFTLDYDLPNDVMYCETCASIGLTFFARQMLRIEQNAEYADVMERALYNTVISGMALDGKHFFYVNPLEVVPSKDKKNPTKSHVKTVRPQWLGCACCPPNLARLVTSLEKYIYTFGKDAILTNLFVDSTITNGFNGSVVTLKQETEYPRKGKIKLMVSVDNKAVIRLGIRIPFWADEYELTLDGKKVSKAPDCGFVFVDTCDGSSIALNLDMKVTRWYANENVRENLGKVAVARGPVVFCAEEKDNGPDLHMLMLPKSAAARYSEVTDFAGIDGIDVSGYRGEILKDAPLYSKEANRRKEKTNIHFIPYYAWANRGENEMRVWINEVDE